MKNARHSKLTEFIGLILEPQRTFIVEGNLYTFNLIEITHSQSSQIEYCSKGSLTDVLANPDIDLAWIFRFTLINDLISGKI